MDDFLFGKIMSDKKTCRGLLEIILHIDPDTEIADPVSQNSLRVSPGAKSVIVDIRTHDALSDYDIEAQENPYWKREYMDAMMAAVRQQREMREAEEKGVQEGEHKRALEAAKRMLGDGLTTELTAKYTGLSITEIQQLQ